MNRPQRVTKHPRKTPACKRHSIQQTKELYPENTELMLKTKENFKYVILQEICKAITFINLKRNSRLLYKKKKNSESSYHLKQIAKKKSVDDLKCRMYTLNMITELQNNVQGVLVTSSIRKKSSVEEHGTCSGQGVIQFGYQVVMCSRRGGRSCRKWGLGDRQGETKVVPGLAKSQEWKHGNRGSRSKAADWLSLSCLYLPLTVIRANPRRAYRYNRKHLAGYSECRSKNKLFSSSRSSLQVRD